MQNTETDFTFEQNKCAYYFYLIRKYFRALTGQGLSCKRTKRTGPQGISESLTHEGPGRFAAPFAVRQSIRSMLNVSRFSTIAKQYFTSCTSVHIIFIFPVRQKKNPAMQDSLPELNPFCGIFIPEIGRASCRERV